jgi:hypothetical protein
MMQRIEVSDQVVNRICVSERLEVLRVCVSVVLVWAIFVDDFVVCTPVLFVSVVVLVVEEIVVGVVVMLVWLVRID